MPQYLSWLTFWVFNFTILRDKKVLKEKSAILIGGNMSTLICTLDLAYPPISNQEGMWFWEDKEVREYFKKSKLYMLVQRKELKFMEIIEKDIKSGIFKFKISMGTYRSSYITYRFTENMEKLIESNGAIKFELGDKLYRITRESDNEVLYWATPDKIIFDIVTKNIPVEMDNIEDIHKLQTFDLLYVGISKENDSFSRLFEKVHHGRLNILSNEYTKEKEARMTDELMILMFEVKWFNINTMNNISNLNDLFAYTDDEKAIVADAEKAFVSILDSKYNEVKFKNYPKGADGLYNKGLQSYSYTINYDLILTTTKADIIGKYGDFIARDAIIIGNDGVKLLKA